MKLIPNSNEIEEKDLHSKWSKKNIIAIIFHSIIIIAGISFQLSTLIPYNWKALAIGLISPIYMLDAIYHIFLIVLSTAPILFLCNKLIKNKLKINEFASSIKISSLVILYIFINFVFGSGLIYLLPNLVMRFFI